MIVLSLLLLIIIKAFNIKSSSTNISQFEINSALNGFQLNEAEVINKHQANSAHSSSLSAESIYTQAWDGNLSSHINDTQSTKIDPIVFSRIASLVLLFAGLINNNFYYMASPSINSLGGIGLFSGLFYVNFTSILIETVIYVTGGLILFSFMSRVTQESESVVEQEKIDYTIIILFSILGSSFLLSCSDLISLYLSIELQSFGLYVLSTLYKNSESSTAAGLKYFLLGGLSSCIILLGTGIVYSYSGLTNLELIYSLLNALCESSSPAAQELTHPVLVGINLGFILIFVGLLFKIAAAPLHNWSPDVYDDTPTVVTIWLTIIPKLSIIILLLELYFQISWFQSSILPDTTSVQWSWFQIQEFTQSANGYLQAYLPEGGLNLLEGSASQENLKVLLLISSLLSLIIGTVVGLAQKKIKRLLAYSTISHIGFLLLALAVKSEQSIDSLLFYIIQYTITNLNIFLILIAFSGLIFVSVRNRSTEGSYKYFGDIKLISDLKGQFYENPFLSLSLIISLFSLAGIPPLLGFFAKQFTLYSAIQSGYYFISIIAIITSVISASYYLKIIKTLMLSFNESDENSGIIASEHQSLNSPSEILAGPFLSYLISSLSLFILLFIFKPSIILSSTGVLSLSLFGFF